MKTTKSRSRSDGGQTMILMALLLGVLIGFVAMVVDVGFMLYERRALQNAADAAALAGAQELSGSPSAAEAIAQQYALANGVDTADPNYTFVATTPYAGDSDAIEVEVTSKVGFLLGPILGLDVGNVSARAVARVTGDPSYALFQTDPGCSGVLDLEDLSTFFIDGAVHADGELELEPSPFEMTGDVTYCGSLKDNSTSLVTGSGPDQVGGPVPPPVDFSYTDFPCTYTFSGPVWKISFVDTPQYFNLGPPKTLKSGVYCSDGNIELAQEDATGNVTFVTHGNFEFEGSNYDLTPYYEDVLVFTDAPIDDPLDPLHGDPQIKSEDNAGTWEGMLLAPNGLVKFERMITATSPGTLLLGSFIDLGGVWSIAGMSGSGSGSGLVALVE